MSYRSKVIIIIIVFVLAASGCAYFLKPEEKTLPNFLSIIGTLLTIAGLLVAYIQISSVKQIAESTKKEVEISMNNYNNLLVLTDLARKAEMCKEIQNFLKDDKIDMCVLRMTDLKEILNYLKHSERYNGILSKRDFNNSFSDFNNDLYNFQRHHVNKKNKIDKEAIIINLERLSTVLLNAVNKIKSLES